MKSPRGKRACPGLSSQLYSHSWLHHIPVALDEPYSWDKCVLKGASLMGGQQPVAGLAGGWTELGTLSTVCVEPRCVWPGCGAKRLDACMAQGSGPQGAGGEEMCGQGGGGALRCHQGRHGCKNSVPPALPLISVCHLGRPICSVRDTADRLLRN